MTCARLNTTLFSVLHAAAGGGRGQECHTWVTCKSAPAAQRVVPAVVHSLEVGQVQHVVHGNAGQAVVPEPLHHADRPSSLGSEPPEPLLACERADVALSRQERGYQERRGVNAACPHHPHIHGHTPTRPTAGSSHLDQYGRTTAHALPVPQVQVRADLGSPPPCDDDRSSHLAHEVMVRDPRAVALMPLRVTNVTGRSRVKVTLTRMRHAPPACVRRTPTYNRMGAFSVLLPHPRRDLAAHQPAARCHVDLRGRLVAEHQPPEHHNG